MQLVWQRVEDWGWDDPPPSLSPSCAQGSSLATAPHCGLALTTWTPVEAGSGQTTRLLSTSTGRVVRHQVWGTGRPRALVLLGAPSLVPYSRPADFHPLPIGCQWSVQRIV